MKEFNLEEVIKISEYVRVSSQSTPQKRTKDIIQEYITERDDRRKKNKLKWWENLSDYDKIRFTGELRIFTDEEIFDIYHEVKFGY